MPRLKYRCFRHTRELGKPRVGETQHLELAQFALVCWDAAIAHGFFSVHNALELAQEPRLIMGDAVDILKAHAFADRLCDTQDAVRLGHAKVTLDRLQVARAGLIAVKLDLVQAGQPGLHRAHGLLQAFGKTAAHGHGFTH